MLIWLSYQSGGETELGEILSRLQREARQVLLKHGGRAELHFRSLSPCQQKVEVLQSSQIIVLVPGKSTYSRTP